MADSFEYEQKIEVSDDGIDWSEKYYIAYQAKSPKPYVVKNWKGSTNLHQYVMARNLPVPANLKAGHPVAVKQSVESEYVLRFFVGNDSDGIGIHAKETYVATNGSYWRFWKVIPNYNYNKDPEDI